MTPFRVLDAPALRDDFYCSLLAYSSTLHCLAVGLGPHVYLWSEKPRNASVGSPDSSSQRQLPDSLTSPFGAHVTSLSFSSTIGDSAILAIGGADGRITLWSPKDTIPRFDSEQPSPISCVSFRPTSVRRPSQREPGEMVATEELLVGDEAGNVYFYTIEWPDQLKRDLFDWPGSMKLFLRIASHSQQICGLAWSASGEYFATGGNDNLIHVFLTKNVHTKGPPSNSSPSSDKSSTTPLQTHDNRASSNDTATLPPHRQHRPSVFTLPPGSHHQTFTLLAAVKALSFAPWNPHLLAAGGGSNDRCIHFLHAASGAALATIDCHAQVTALVWSTTRPEIAATFGFAQPDHPFRVAVFAWPSCACLVRVPWWGEERALWAVGYPGGPAGGADRRRQAAATKKGGGAWSGRSSREEEGCLVVATSDASIKFHEVWTERPRGGAGRRGQAGSEGLLGGSQILEGECSVKLAREGWIR